MNTDNNKYSITANQKVVKGYSTEVCVQCKTDEQTIQRDGFKISQTTKCQKSLSKAQKPLGSQDIDLGGEINDVKIGNGWPSFFANSETEKCPINSCVLKNKGCQTAYTGNNIKISQSKPWYLTTSRTQNNVDQNDLLCIQCSNGEQTITHDNFKVRTFNSCLKSLTTSGSFVVPELKYGQKAGKRNLQAKNVNNRAYRGKQNVTRNGYTCQAWASQSPHQHDKFSTNFVNQGLESNYCRNPDGSSSIWCYTTNPNVRIDWCDPIVKEESKPIVLYPKPIEKFSNVNIGTGW